MSKLSLFDDPLHSERTMQKTVLIKNVLVFAIIGACLFMAGILLPLIALPAMLFFALPALLLSYEDGTASAVASVAFGALILCVFVSPFFSVIYAVAFGLPGVLTGQAAKKIKSAGDLILCSVVCSLACKLTVVYLFYKMTGNNLLIPDSSQIEQVLASIAQSRFGEISGSGMKAFEENIDNVVAYLIMLIPYSLIFFAVTETMCCCIAASFIHRKKNGEPFFLLPPFGEWAFPKNVVIALLAGFVCDIIASKNPEMYIMKQVGANLNAVSRTLFIIQGLAATYCVMSLRGFSKFVRVAIIVITPLFTFLGDIFSIVGIVDLGFDLRKRLRGTSR